MQSENLKKRKIEEEEEEEKKGEEFSTNSNKKNTNCHQNENDSVQIDPSSSLIINKNVASSNSLSNSIILKQFPNTSSPNMKGIKKRYLLTVEYMGSAFFGFQKQKNLRTVQGVLEEAFFRFLNQPVEVFGSSRTDTGVNASGNTFHVDIERISKRNPNKIVEPFPPLVVKNAMNSFLFKIGKDISIKNAISVSEKFHARHAAVERTYHYRIMYGKSPPSIFNRDYFWHVTEELNLKEMMNACALLEGHHDFSTFRASGCQAKSSVRTLTELSVIKSHFFLQFPSMEERMEKKRKYLKIFSKMEERENGNEKGVCDSNEKENNGDGDEDEVNERGSREKEEEKERVMENKKEEVNEEVMEEEENDYQCFVITARARSFLYHQVRLLVGLLKAVGCGDVNPNDVPKLLAAKSNQVLPPMAPAHALFLHTVKYDSERLDEKKKRKSLDSNSNSNSNSN